MVTVQMLALGIIGDALAGQRVIGQRIHERVRRLELAAGVEPSHYQAGVGRPSADAHRLIRRRRGRQRLRQVRTSAPDRAPAGRQASSARSTSWSRSPAPAEAHEVGCGEGELAIRLARRGLRVRGSDVAAEVVAEARRRAAAAGLEIEFRRAPIEELAPAGDAAELVVCCEVLEHLADPERGARGARPRSRARGCSSASRANRVWRVLNLARGHYVARARQHARPPQPLVAARRSSTGSPTRLSVVEVRAPLPWTMALCRA